MQYKKHKIQETKIFIKNNLHKEKNWSSQHFLFKILIAEEVQLIKKKPDVSVFKVVAKKCKYRKMMEHTMSQIQDLLLTELII